MEIEYQTLDTLKPNFKTITHYKPYKFFKEPMFEFKVIYMRFISSSADMQTSCMTLNFPPRDPHTCLQINGVIIHPTEKISRPLNKHREDAFMSESVYVNTDRIKFKGKHLPFEVHIEGLESSVLVSGVLRRKGGSDDCIWAMECEGGDGVKDFDVGKVDAYVAGWSLGKPLLLNEVVELYGCKELECIPQAHDMENYISKELEAVYIQEFEHRRNEGFTAKAEEILAEEGELSWFNAGVRLGIGLGVGMSLGVGVGLGLIIRAYKSTSGVFRKLLP